MSYEITVGGKKLDVNIEKIGRAEFKVMVDGRGPFFVDAHRTEPTVFSVLLNQKSYEIDVEEIEDGFNIYINGDCFAVQVLDERRKLLKRSKEAVGGKQVISTTMPGKVV